MMRSVLVACLVSLLVAVKGDDRGLVNVPVSRDCSRLHPVAGLSARYYESMAHASHSMTVQGLRIFNPKVTEHNNIPTRNRNMSNPVRVLDYAPDVPLGDDFATEAMNAIDSILSGVGHADDGLGPSWSPVQCIAHYFHMWDLWTKVQQVHEMMVRWEPPADDVCACLMDVKNNGIWAALQWMADQYERPIPLALHKQIFPKLTDATTWMVWKEGFLHYYDKQSLFEAALFVNCATRAF